MTAAVARQASIGWLFFSPSGRAGRQVFILGWLFWMMVNSYTLTKATLSQDEDGTMPVWGFVFIVSVVLSVASAIMMTIKRLHDVGLPAPVSVLMVVPILSFVFLFALCLWPSSPGSNRFGPKTDWPQS
ncbi:DUF805 domain-containing protein [Ciceribacter sp. L1K23]|uniref:DUF805 domain-containing protein n=1 Tax=Ciceribacter sp. L1K23 TaxID=2820276 RepID=UPI001B831031|nr:DUF805 domain-containing protein [Ciceribacter sp. L1K23]MBR0557161.1 DUF805 domain-containing protein [Ciceribacter sp. L1K23]